MDKQKYNTNGKVGITFKKRVTAGTQWSPSPQPYLHSLWVINSKKQRNPNMEKKNWENLGSKHPLND